MRTYTDMRLGMWTAPKAGATMQAGAMALGLAMSFAMAGCMSQQDKAIDTAKKQAAATGQAQQVVSVDKNGNTTTTTVQPPAAGQTTQAVTTVVTPASAGSGWYTGWYAVRCAGAGGVWGGSCAWCGSGAGCCGRASGDSAGGREYSGGDAVGDPD